MCILLLPLLLPFLMGVIEEDVEGYVYTVELLANFE